MITGSTTLAFVQAFLVCVVVVGLLYEHAEGSFGGLTNLFIDVLGLSDKKQCIVIEKYDFAFTTYVLMKFF